MKEFKLFGATVAYESGLEASPSVIIKANSYDDIILELESESGWIIRSNAAFKVVFIKEIRK